MARMEKVTTSHVLKGLIALSVISCFAVPGGFDRPRELLAPVLSPISHGGTYVSDTVGRNLTDLLGGDCDDQTARDVLAANPELQRRLTELLAATLQRRVVTQEEMIRELRAQLAEMGQTRKTLTSDFPCKLIPARVIGDDIGPYGRSRLLRSSRSVASGDVVTTRELITRRPTAIPEGVAALSGAVVVGRIASSGAWTAHLQLVTDPDFRTRAMVVRVPRRDRKPIMVEAGDGGRTILVRKQLEWSDAAVPVNLTGRRSDMISAAVPAHHEIEPGDFVVTAGDDRRLPMRITIGRVTDVQTLADTDKHVRLTVTPAADLASLRRVTIVQSLATGGD